MSSINNEPTSSSSSIQICTAPSSSSSSSSQYQLLEIHPDLLPLFSSKQTKVLTIKGNPDDQAVLTTDDKTYALRLVSQSNSLLLCNIAPSLTHDGDTKPLIQLQSNVMDTLELIPIVPRLERIGSLLRESRYQGPDEESSKINITKYTRKQIESSIQASAKELEDGLTKYHVIEFNGYLRQLSPDYITLILRSLMNFIDLHAYLPNQLPLQLTLSSLESTYQHPRSVIFPILTQFFGSQINQDTIQLSCIQIVTFLGIQQLNTCRIPSSLSEFLQRWTQSVDPLFSHLVDLSLLSGEYLLHPAPTPSSSSSSSFKSIQKYSKSQLPLDPVSRFQELFLTRSQWLSFDLEPFIIDLAPTSKKQLDVILLKYTRSSKAVFDSKPVVFYSSKVKW